MPTEAYPRWLAKRCWEIFHNQGKRSLLKKGSRYAISEARQATTVFPPIDNYAFRKSVRRLEQRKRQEDDLEDILDTAYNFKGFGNYNNITPGQRRNAFRGAIEEIGNYDIETVLEIGTQRGGSLYIWSRHFDADVVSVDINYMGRDKFLNTIDNGLQFVEGNSQKLAVQNRVDEFAPAEGFDLIFIDGDHSYEGAKKDYETYSQFASDDGIIAFDDIGTYYGVSDLWNELKENHDYEEVPDYDPLFGLLFLGPS